MLAIGSPSLFTRVLKWWKNWDYKSNFSCTFLHFLGNQVEHFQGFEFGLNLLVWFGCRVIWGIRRIWRSCFLKQSMWIWVLLDFSCQMWCPNLIRDPWYKSHAKMQTFKLSLLFFYFFNWKPKFWVSNNPLSPAIF